MIGQLCGQQFVKGRPCHRQQFAGGGFGQVVEGLGQGLLPLVSGFLATTSGLWPTTR
jgi:hypothetical protein